MYGQKDNKVYPEDYSCIVEPQGGRGGLFIGNLEAAQNINTLQKHQIRAVLTAAKGVDITHPKNDIPYTLYVPADDHESFDISKYFQQAGSFISDCLSRTNIMVHCLAGVSRSVSLVLGYFIQHKGMTYSQAYDLVKSRRKIIHPNDGFIASLKKLEQVCRSSSPPRERYSPSPARPSYGSQQAHYEHAHSVSPSKSRPTLDFQSRISQYKEYRRNNYESPSKNPELFLNYRKEASPQRVPISEDRSGRIKRISSMKVENEPVWEGRNTQLREWARPRTDFNPLESIQNRSQFTTNPSSDIDRKIEEIRKKYQEYSSGSYGGYTSKYQRTTGTNGAGFEERKTGNGKYDENVRMRMSGNFNEEERYYTFDRSQLRSNIPPAESTQRLKRLTSLQEY